MRIQSVTRQPHIRGKYDLLRKWDIFINLLFHILQKWSAIDFSGAVLNALLTAVAQFVPAHWDWQALCG